MSADVRRLKRLGKEKNTNGFLDLADELLLEILSYFPPVPLSHDCYQPTRLRRETLLALSQTCSRLRRFYRPFIWERIEVYTGMLLDNGVMLDQYENRGQGSEGYALELLRQLGMVTIEDPTLAQHVR